MEATESVPRPLKMAETLTRPRKGLLGMLLLAATAGPVCAESRQIPMTDFVQEVCGRRGPGSLPHPTVTRLLQTRDGYLWIGTYTGVVRFDGRQFYVPP